MTDRQRRYARKNPNFSTLPPEILRHVGSFLPKEGVKPAKGEFHSNYYTRNNRMYISNYPNSDLTYRLVS